MRASDFDILFVPDSPGADADFWQSRWAARLSSARFVETPEGATGPRAVVEAAALARRPILFIAYSRGAIAVAQGAPDLRPFDVRGAFLVAPPSEKVLATLDEGRWAPIPRERLPWPSMLAASRTDPWASMEESRALAESWGAEFVDAGDAGRIDVASDHGPWPDGLLKLAGLLKRL
jgi:predicted alpha/beta hydrolase family esterase